VTDTRFMLRGHVAALVALAAELDARSDSGFTAAEFRDASGIGRNFIILLLEFFDRIGVTRRVGAGRKIRPDWEAVVGAAKPWRC
jgi:selenocysteine-specific elongation factor